MKSLILFFGLVTGVSSPTVLILNSIDDTTLTTNDLNNINIVYLSHVIHMNDITDSEATTIKTGINNTIKTEMDALNCKTGVDYSVDGIDGIIANANLNDITIMINSITTSKKLTGNKKMTLNTEENIATWITADTIKIKSINVNSLPESRIESLKADITIGVGEVMSQGQNNVLDTDYVIEGLELIITGAKFSDYSTNIIVRGTTQTYNLIGSFIVPFEIKQ